MVRTGEVVEPAILSPTRTAICYRLTELREIVVKKSLQDQKWACSMLMRL